jgi:hypothetical protein
MDSITRYYLGKHECGLWHVIDSETGVPVEVEADGVHYLLWRLPRKEAEQWSLMLNGRSTGDGTGVDLVV